MSGSGGRAWLRPRQMGVRQREGGLGTVAPSLIPLPLGPSRRDGVAVAVVPPAFYPHGVWWVPPLPHQSSASLEILGRTSGREGHCLISKLPCPMTPPPARWPWGGLGANPGQAGERAEGWDWGGLPWEAAGSQVCRGIQVFQVSSVSTVAANVAPTFLANMSRVNLPEDLPVGESPTLCTGCVKSLPTESQGLPYGLVSHSAALGLIMGQRWPEGSLF